MSTAHLDICFGARTHQGAVRSHNEDSFLTAPPYFVVADGMGGHAKGEVASRAAVEPFLSAAGQQWTTVADLATTIDKAGAAVSALGGAGRPPGTTLSGVGLVVQNGIPCWLVFNIGDSRTYLLRNNELIQISVDHSAVREQEGNLPRNVITRALGAGLSKPLVADQWILPIVRGDMILVCSDGLYNEVTDHLIAALLLSAEDPHDKATALVEAAIRAGGRDNVTAVVIVATAVEGSFSPDESDETTLQSKDDTVQDED